MMALSVPVISVVLGEGGSGGALAIAVADRVAMLSNAVYSILSPEGFASILWKDASRAGEAADVMKITAYELHEMGIIDSILPEPDEGAHTDPDAAVSAVSEYIGGALNELCALTAENLREGRYKRFRAF